MTMRVSTGMIYDAGVGSINKQTSNLLHTQQQIAAGTSILVPSDNPVAAARALEVTQSIDITKQYTSNQSTATSSLGLVDTNLSNATDLMIQVKQLAVQGANGTLTATDRQSIATQLSADYDQLMGIANSTDGTGQYLFAGYQNNTQPFTGSVAAGVTYHGDDGQRLQQVSASRQIPISASGNAVFMRVPSGNGDFSTNYSAANTGTGSIDVGSVNNPVMWNSAANSGNLQVAFAVDPVTNATTYDLVDMSAGAPGVSLFTGAPPTPPYGQTYTPGQAISFSGTNAATGLAFDYGASVTVSGAPANGDSFSVTKSSSQSIFTTLGNLITALQSSSTSTAAGAAKFATDMGSALVNIDQASQSILTVRANVGASMNEVSSLQTVNSALNIQYSQTLSNLQDLDYAKAITDLTRGQTQLQASQQSFAKVAQLSLFNYL